MTGFLQLCSAFISGCAEFFNLTVPGLNVSFFTLFVGFMVADVILSTVMTVFGVRDEAGSCEVGSTPKHYGGRHFVYRRGNRTAKDYGFKEIN